MVEEGFHYVDKTGYIRVLEGMSNSYLFYMRPRRFGKSLLVSMLMHYYGEQHRGDFERLFGAYDIGRNPTSLANRYLTLSFDFSGIDTSTRKGVEAGFLRNLLEGIQYFLLAYPQYFNAEEEQKRFEKLQNPVDAIKQLFLLVKAKAPDKQVYLFIDEYDHFANEILAYDFDYFREILSTQGFVRKFYEAIKTATASGVVARFFGTGVMPLTLDSMTSGFNIATNATTDRWLGAMMGFRETDVRTILEGIEAPPDKFDDMLRDMKVWYDGYRFHENSEEPLYNANMVLYFAEHYRRNQRYPQNMLDGNVASDYQKVGRLFRLVNPELNLGVLQEIVGQGYTEANLIELYNFDLAWSRDHFISLLYYLGYLTLAPSDNFSKRFAVPNYVIRELYFQYFLEVQLQRADMDRSALNLSSIGSALALQNDPKPFAALLGDILKNLADRDKVGFSEKHAKAVAVAILHTANVFFIKSEYPLQGGYLDILLLQRPQYRPHHQMAIELKYLAKKDEADLENAVREGKAQLARYKQDPQLASLERLKAWLLVFVGNEPRAWEEV